MKTVVEQGRAFAILSDRLLSLASGCPLQTMKKKNLLPSYEEMSAKVFEVKKEQTTTSFCIVG